MDISPTVKHYLSSKQEALLPTAMAMQHQAMLPEGKALGEKIREALKLADLSVEDVEKRFRITRQAVSSWQRTGRIGTNRLLELIRMVQPRVPIGFWEDATIVELAHATTYSPRRDKKKRPAWPFTTNEEAVCDLKPEILEAIDAQLVHHVNQHESSEPARRARRR